MPGISFIANQKLSDLATPPLDFIAEFEFLKKLPNTVFLVSLVYIARVYLAQKIQAPIIATNPDAARVIGVQKLIGFGMSTFTGGTAAFIAWGLRELKRRNLETFTPPDSDIHFYDSLEMLSKESYTHQKKKMLGNSLDPLFAITRQVSASFGTMGEATRLSVVVPVAAHEEGSKISRLIRELAKQDLPRKRFEVCLFLNFPPLVTEKQNDTILQTIETIERMKQKYPNLQIRAATASIEEFCTGEVRKIATDAVVLRTKDPAHILVRMDADTVAMSPNALSSMITPFRTAPYPTLVSVEHFFDTPSVLSDPLLTFGLLLMEELTSLYRNGFHVGAPASATLAAYYVEVKGYPENVLVAEDVALDRRLLKLNDDPTDNYAHVNDAKVFTSGRRAIDAMKSGFAPMYQWAWGFGADNESVRVENDNANAFDLGRFADVLAGKMMVEHLTEVLCRSMVALPGQNTTDVLEYLEKKFKFSTRIEHDRVTIVEWEGLKDYLLEFAERQSSAWKI